jgi:hypothetical protein
MTLLPIVDDINATIAAVETALNKLLSAYSGIATRSVSIGVVNNTNSTLKKSAIQFSHGGIDPQFDLPEQLIPPGGADKFSVTSTGLATGVEGTAFYTALDDDGNDAGVSIQLFFDNPFISNPFGGDGNTYTANVVPPTDSFEADQTGSSGNHSKVRYDITAS